MLILSDLVNALISLIIIIIALRIKIIPNWIDLFLVFIPLFLFLNEVLFHVIFPINLYIQNLEEVRSLNFFLIKSQVLYYYLVSFIASSICRNCKKGFYNRLLFLILFLWLYRKNFLSGMSLNS